jgi:hypothetical protein
MRRKSLNNLADDEVCVVEVGMFIRARRQLAYESVAATLAFDHHDTLFQLSAWCCRGLPVNSRKKCMFLYQNNPNAISECPFGYLDG